MTLWRSFLAVAESFLDLCRRFVVDTQEPMAAALITATTVPGKEEKPSCTSQS
jgi:hypothetical protein